MRVINSAAVLAGMRREKLVVLWYVCPELGCRFTDLFLPVNEPDIKIIDITSLKDSKKIYYQASARQRFGNADILAARDDGGSLSEGFVSSLGKRVYISTWEHFYPSGDYSLYRPVPELQSRIDDMTLHFGESCTGVHIRRTDNTVSMGKSTTEQFISEMEKALEKRPATRFFLATDDIDEEKTLRGLFPGKIISNQERDPSRDSLSGMKDAVVDLFCLAACDHLIGSYWSSFTDTAADMHGIEKVIAGDCKP